MELCSRLAEARLRLASVEATISGHGASTGVIEERRLRPALPKRRRRDGERDGGPRDGDLTAQIRIESVRIGPYKVKQN